MKGKRDFLHILGTISTVRVFEEVGSSAEGAGIATE